MEKKKNSQHNFKVESPLKAYISSTQNPSETEGQFTYFLIQFLNSRCNAILRIEVEDIQDCYKNLQIYG